MIVIASVSLLNTALKTWVFTQADNDFYRPRIVCPINEEGFPQKGCNEEDLTEEDVQAKEDQGAAQRQRDLAQNIAMLIVATPVFLFHFRLARRET